MHATSSRAAIERLVTLAMEAGPQVTNEAARRKLAEHIDFIVQVKVRRTAGDPPGKHRYVAEVIAVESGDDGGIAVTDIFSCDSDSTTARPRFLPQHIADELAGFGFDDRPFHGISA